MKTNPDTGREDELLDAVLRDENWEAGNAAFKAAALGRFQAHQRARRAVRWGGGVAGLAVVAAVAVAMHRQGRVGAVQQQATGSGIEAPKETQKVKYMTDEELLAAFPKGSCFLAEVDGKKELVFLDPEVAKASMAGGGELAGNGR